MTSWPLRKRLATCRPLLLVAGCAFAMAAALLLHAPHAGLQADSGAQPDSAPQRIISLVPAVTEMLFAIGAGPRVVGVSSFDRHPPEVARLERVGALIDPDLEKILSLRPNLVVIYGSQEELRVQLERAQIPAFLYTHGGLADVTATMRRLGARVGRADAAGRAAEMIEAHLQEIGRRVAGRPRARTVLVFGREARVLRGIYASGGKGFLHDMLEAAGGTNVFADVDRENVQATTELILARRPEAIVELRVTRLDAAALAAEVAAWKPLAAVPAVRNGRVHIVADERMVVPGPRVAEATELLSRALHPAAWR